MTNLQEAAAVVYDTLVANYAETLGHQMTDDSLLDEERISDIGFLGQMETAAEIVAGIAQIEHDFPEDVIKAMVS